MSVRCSEAKTNYRRFLLLVEKVKFYYSSFSNRAPNYDMLMKVSLVEIIMYGTSQNLQQVSVKKGKAPNHIFKIGAWPAPLKTSKIILHKL